MLQNLTLLQKIALFCAVIVILGQMIVIFTENHKIWMPLLSIASMLFMSSAIITDAKKKAKQTAEKKK